MIIFVHNTGSGLDMGIKLRHGFEVFEFLERGEYVMPIRDQGMALRFLYGLRLDSAQIKDLCNQFLLDIKNEKEVKDPQLLEQLASVLASGRVRLLRRPEMGCAASAGTAAEAQPGQAGTSSASTPRVKSHWVELRVVDDKTGQPIEGVELIVKLPDGRYESLITDAAGSVEINDVLAGECEVSCDLKDGLLSNTHNFVKNEKR